MAKLKDMAYTKAEIKERNSPSKGLVCDSYGSNKYPYGLCINLDTEALKKLGLDQLPKPGKTMTLTARVVVKSASLDERMDGKDNKRLELQIEAMALESGSEDGAVAALEKGLQESKS